MKSFTKAVEAIMLISVTCFAVGCNYSPTNRTKEEKSVSSNTETSEASEASTVRDRHAFVDLGLPSGTLWATCNVGTESPEDFGNYYAWGEVQPKTKYDCKNYKHWIYDEDRPGWNLIDKIVTTKYSLSSQSLRCSQTCDEYATLLPEDDAATANWGNDWRTPTMDEYEELDSYCVKTVVVNNGRKGCLFTAPNGNTLFLPAAGCRVYDAILYENDGGFYQSASLSSFADMEANYYDFGGCHDSGMDDPCDGLEGRDVGRTVRPVYSVPIHSIK